MTSSFSYTDCSTLKCSVIKPLSALNDSIQEGCPQSVYDPPNHCVGAAGVLKYNRESDNQRLNLPTILPEPSTECQIKCEYCGQKARPSLDLAWLQETETFPPFCCSHRQQLCELLIKQRRLVERRYNRETGRLTTPEDKPSTELFFQGRKMEDHNKFMVDLPSMLRYNSREPEMRVLEDYSIQLPEVETYTPVPKVFSFRLSCAPQEGCWVMNPSSPREDVSKFQVEEMEVPFCDPKPLQFGICHNYNHRDQDGSGYLQKYYSNGMTFLNMFPDGSAQVFYPSGNLAVIVVVTQDNRRVCIVYDETPDRPTRAVFQSDGRGTCYHTNGSIWLTLDRSGGQCLDQDGARVRRWIWCDPSSTPTSLRPIFLSINRTIGLRVLRKEQVVVSFLAKGQQAKFSVGSASCDQEERKSDGCAPEPSMLKEELIALAAQMKMRLLLQHLHQYLTTPSRPKVPKPTPPPHTHVFAQRLLEESKGAKMSQREKEFIHGCLQFCHDIT